MKIYFYCLLLCAMFCSRQTGYAQANSNKGTEFWTAYMAHINGVGGNNGSRMSLYITGDVATTGTVQVADGTSTQTFSVTPNQITVVDIPASAYLASESQYNKGIHITSAKPIVVYAHIYAQARSGATLVLPVASMAKDYYTINYTQKSANTYSTFCVIATEDNTTVEITPAAALIGGTAAKQTKTVTLQKGELYQGLSLSDLTGTRVRSVSSGTAGCKKIAVYSGSTFVYIGCSTKSSGDNLFQQIYPTASWGKNFVTAPLYGRAYDIFRIVCSDPAAKVTVNGALLPASQLINNFYYELSQSNTPNVITSDKPIQVAQYAVTMQNALNCGINNQENVGDPEMIFLSPIEQGLDKVTLYSPSVQNIVQSYVNVIIPASAANTFTLDGVAYTNFTPIAGSNYAYAQIPVNSGTHNIGAGAVFNAVAYGFGSVESYGYAAGTNLKNLNEFVQLGNPVTDSLQTAGCSNVDYKLRVTIPYKTAQVIWKFVDLNKTDTLSYTQPTDSVKVNNGTQTLYVYQYSKLVNFAPGTHSVIASVFNAVADECGSYEDVDFDFQISSPPAVDFALSAHTCLGDSTTFADKTPNDVANPSKMWLWDFGDGQTSTLQNPTHLYTAAGNYQIKLVVTNQNGCTNISALKTVHITKVPQAAFTVGAIDCAGQQVQFTDNSVANEGNIISWHWNYGDTTATADSVSSLQNPVHTYSKAGTYNVSLVVTTDSGCVSSKLIPVVVYPTPQVSFNAPTVCLSEGTVNFTNTSKIANGTEANFTYAWNFGDTYNPSTNTANTKSPGHKYTQVGNYQVRLTVTSKYGCVHDTTQTVAVNSSNPHAEFTVPAAICSNEDLVITSQSFVAVGQITRYKVYYDVLNNPTQTEVFDNTHTPIPANKTFTHNYGLSASSRTYQVRIEVFSGDSDTDCTDSKTYAVKVNANPLVTLSNIPVVACQQSGPVTVLQNTHGFTGTATFTGDGISTSGGVFDPKNLSPGQHTYSYHFVSAGTGCVYDTTFSIAVNATPIINTEPEVTILAGSQTILDAKAQSPDGSALSYNWAPAAGLSSSTVPNPVANPLTDTRYTLTVTSANGCPATAQVLVRVLQAPVVPNTFTPNGDGTNDTWNIKYLNLYTNCTVEIFNRNGERVYSSIGYPAPWDGRYKGADLPVGTYYYLINPKNGRKVIAGYLTIVR